MTLPVDEPRVEVALARIEGKLDLLSHSLNAVSTDLLDHEIRLRAQEARPAIPAEVDERLRVLEARPVVTTRQIAGWITLAATAIGGAASAALLFRQ